MSKNTFRLGVHPSSYYLSLFERDQIRICPPRRGQRPFPACGLIEIGEGDLEFEVLFPQENGAVLGKHIDVARSVFAQIVEMNDSARDLETDLDYDEVLAYVLIDDLEVDFYHFASTVNTEWNTSFRLDVEGRWVWQGSVRNPTTSV